MDLPRVQTTGTSKAGPFRDRFVPPEAWSDKPLSQARRHL